MRIAQEEGAFKAALVEDECVQIVNIVMERPPGRYTFHCRVMNGTVIVTKFPDGTYMMSDPVPL